MKRRFLFGTARQVTGILNPVLRRIIQDIHELIDLDYRNGIHLLGFDEQGERVQDARLCARRRELFLDQLPVFPGRDRACREQDVSMIMMQRNMEGAPTTPCMRSEPSRGRSLLG